MKRSLVAVSAVAFVCLSSPAFAKKKEKVITSSIDAPAGQIKPVLASWPNGVTPTTPTIAPDAFLPTNSEIVIRFNSELNSKTVRERATFVTSVAQDVMLGNLVIIPKGTPANGVVTWRTGKGAFGKSAKIEYEIRSMDLGGQRIPLSGKFREEGRGNTGAAVGAAVAVGVFGAFVTGRSAVVEQGNEAKVYTIAAIPISLPAETVAAPSIAPVAPSAPITAGQMQ
jgi:hypothetical protein